MTTHSLSKHVGGEDLLKYRQLFNAVRSGEAQLVSSLLSQGMDVNLRGPRGATPLHIAARFGQMAMVDLLLEHGADATARDDSGKSPFDKARANGASSLISTKLSQSMPAGAAPPSCHRAAPPYTATTPATPAQPAAPGGDGRGGKEEAARCRRLLESAYRGEMPQLDELLRADPALVSKPGPRGATALHVAARYGHPAAVALLLRYGADPLAKDEKGNTPIDKARQMRQHEAFAMLSSAISDARPPMSALPQLAAPEHRPAPTMLLVRCAASSATPSSPLRIVPIHLPHGAAPAHSRGPHSCPLMSSHVCSRLPRSDAVLAMPLPLQRGRCPAGGTARRSRQGC